MGKTTIDRRWLPLNALRAFEGVAKHSSFTAAANALLISQSALSRHVIALEKLIGAQLFERVVDDHDEVEATAVQGGVDDLT